MTTINYSEKTKVLIDQLKGVCAAYGLGNDGNEFKIITQSFLYKFLNDKFGYEAKKIDNKLATANEKWTDELADYNDNDFQLLQLRLGANCAKFKREHFLSYLFNHQNDSDFSKTFDDTLRDIANDNNDVFSVKTEGGAKITLFEPISNYISDPDKRNDFCRAIINKLVEFSFEEIFVQKFDFFSTIFEYMISDYNKDGGGKYAEYYTPHAVAKIMAAILVDGEVQNVTCYDPSAGSGSLLMSLAHAIGEKNCSIYSQDISQKSSNLLRLNLILNNLVDSIPNVIQGNTLTAPYHKNNLDGTLRKFDYIVSNPPFKLDFSDYHSKLTADIHKKRFFAGVPNIPKKDVDKMAIYLLFIQHIIFSLSAKGKAAIVVPTGFITAQSGIEKKIRERLVDEKMLRGVVSMPSNIFATTGTNVSVLFIDKTNDGRDGVCPVCTLVDASKLGETIKEGKNQKTLLRDFEEQQIVDAFRTKEAIEDFSVVVSYDEIKEKNYSLSAGQYFDIKIEYVDITPEEFEAKMKGYKENLSAMFAEGAELEKEIMKQLEGLGL
ncbi:DNA methyltransferase [Bacteroidia bacterium]|nr:DNA methyltransferase [Bacteroidia bacterium]